MHLFITGGSGLVGAHLARHFLDSGHRVTATGYRATHEIADRDRFRYISADTTRSGSWQEVLPSADAVVNLAGKTIFKRWSRAYKQAVYESRIETTKRVVEAMGPGSTKVLCSVSAVGYYGDQGDRRLTEDAPPGDGFLARVAVDWEAEAAKAETAGIRVVLPRLGIVLDRSGGAIGKMLPAFKAFAGGPVGGGDQWFPWIHVSDLTKALEAAVTDDRFSGPYNLCSPNPVRNRELAQTLGRVLRRPSAVPVPATMLKMALGEMASMLLASHRVYPDRLMKTGFAFRFTELESALRDLVGSAHTESGARP